MQLAVSNSILIDSRYIFQSYNDANYFKNKELKNKTIKDIIE
jgi:hypothetical protein